MFFLVAGVEAHDLHCETAKTYLKKWEILGLVSFVSTISSRRFDADLALRNTTNILLTIRTPLFDAIRNFLDKTEAFARRPQDLGFPPY